MTAPDVPTVWLRDYPVALGLAEAEHVAGWVREFQLVALSSPDGRLPSDVPARLASMVEHLSSAYAVELSEAEQLRDAAADRGEARVDLPYPVLPVTEQAVRGWRDMVREVDAYCRDQGMLTLERPPELVALSAWVVEEFLRQVHGEQPRPWPGPWPQPA